MAVDVNRILKTPQRLRAILPHPLKAILRQIGILFLFSDWRSIVAYFRAAHPALAQHAHSEVRLRVRQLQGEALTIRSKSADHSVLFSSLVHQPHVPPKELLRSGELLFFDLGANIGCTMAHLACLFPKAKIVGVELDGENVALCEKNIAPWKDRCVIVEAAVWYEVGEITYARPSNRHDSFRIVDNAVDAVSKARAITINTLLKEYAAGCHMVDYVKMDIEGAERHVLRYGTEWASRVRCLKVELHDYTLSECISDLEKLGFHAIKDTSHNLCVLGYRNDA